MGAFSTIRGIVFVVGVLSVLGGFAIMAALPSEAPGGLWAIAVGGFLMVVVVLERRRYRSEAAERTNEPIGPGGGETAGAIEPRFQRTDEVFVDPSTHVRMRVLVDPRNGERRYVADER
jgi:hypothetical protein